MGRKTAGINKGKNITWEKNQEVIGIFLCVLNDVKIVDLYAKIVQDLIIISRKDYTLHTNLLEHLSDSRRIHYIIFIRRNKMETKDLIKDSIKRTLGCTILRNGECNTNLFVHDGLFPVIEDRVLDELCKEIDILYKGKK